MTAIETLAEFVVRGCPVGDTLLQDRVRMAITDMVGCMLAGSQSPIAAKTVTTFEPIAPGLAPVYGTSLTLSPPFAAMANAIAGHAHELDDWEEPGNTHPSVVMGPALAAASTLKPSTGHAFLVAYATGFEVIARLGEAMTMDHYARGFHTTATLGAIGAAAAVANLLELDPCETAHALALSVSQAMGYTEQFGSDAKPVQAGLAAKAGLLSALMARSGITASPDMLDTAKGMNGLLGAGTGQTFLDAFGKLGDPPALLEYGVILKPWPSCGYTHRLMTCALDLRQRNDLDLGAITGIRGRMPDFHRAILLFGKPRSANEALFSIEACVAHTLLQGNLTLADLENRYWEDPPTRALADTVSVATEAPLDRSLNYDPLQPDRLEIRLSDGTRLEASSAYPLGAPSNPMSQDQLAEKFRNVSGHDLRIFDRIMAWPEAKDIAAHLQMPGGPK